jgi:hypothetical protein
MKQPKTLPIKTAAPIGIGFGDGLGCVKWTKEYRREYMREYIPKWRKKNADKVRIRTREQVADWRRSHPEAVKEDNALRLLKYHLKKRKQPND